MINVKFDVFNRESGVMFLLTPSDAFGIPRCAAMEALFGVLRGDIVAKTLNKG